MVALEVYPNLSPQDSYEKDKSIKTNTSSGIIYDKLMVRHWDRWGAYTKRRHIFISPLDVTSEGLLSLDNNKLIDTMYGLESDCPGKAPGQGEEEFNVSSNGRYIAIAKRRTNDDKTQLSSFSWTTDVPIYLAEIPFDLNNKTNISFELVSDNSWHGLNTSPIFTPDNDYLLFLSMKRPKYESDKLQIRIYNINTKELESLTENIDVSFNSIEFGKCTSDYITIFSNACYHGVSRIFKLIVNITKIPTITSIDIMVGSNSKSSPLYVYNPYSPDKNYIESLYFLESNLMKPNELKICPLNQSNNKFFETFNPITILDEGVVDISFEDENYIFREIFNPSPEYINGDRLLSTPKQHYFKGAHDEYVHSWYLPPTGYTDEQLSTIKENIPIVLIVHGGPQGAILNNWSYRWNMNIFAAQGYAVYSINFHGSISYGQDFVDSINSDWGGKPYEDLIIGMKYILNQYSYIDPKRIAALGASYGGYMMNWINGHTDMFKCLVNHDGIFSLKNLYFSTEELWFPEFDLGLPWEKKELYEKFSPDSYVENWKTPMLVIHGGLDYRICETEAISTFTALQRLEIDSQFLYFPDENHWVLKRLNSKKWHETVFVWLKKYLKD